MLSGFNFKFKKNQQFALKILQDQRPVCWIEWLDKWILQKETRLRHPTAKFGQETYNE